MKVTTPKAQITQRPADSAQAKAPPQAQVQVKGLAAEVAQQRGFLPTSQMDQSLPSVAGQIGQVAPQKGQSPLEVRMSAADRRAGAFAELERDALKDLGLDVKSETALLKLADKVAKAVDGGTWRSLLRWADADHKATQMGDFKMGAPQYAAELLGLNSVGNNLRQSDGEKWAPEHMDRVRDLELTEASWFDQGARLVTLKGQAEVKGEDGELTWLDVAVMVDLRNPDDPRLTGGVG
jgi:hypothetical protein